MVRVALLVAGTLLAGCGGPTITQNGTPIDSARVATIQRGKTPISEVMSMFGPPSSETLIGNNMRYAYWSYFRSEVSTTISPALFIPIAASVAYMSGVRPNISSNMRTQSLQVTYRPTGIVDDFQFTDSNGTGGGLGSALMGGAPMSVRR